MTHEIISYLKAANDNNKPRLIQIFAIDNSDLRKEQSDARSLKVKVKPAYDAFTAKAASIIG